MNLSQARTELKARGFDFLSDSRLTTFLNEASHELNERASWPWLETTTSGTAPLTISDLRSVLHVKDDTNDRVLHGYDIRHLLDMGTDLTTTGNPYAFYLDGLTTLKVYPANTTVTVAVRYIKTAADLSGDSDTPVFPTRYHSLWVDLAQVRALAEDQDNPDRAARLLAETERKIAVAADSLLDRVHSNPGFIARSGWHFDE